MSRILCVADEPSLELVLGDTLRRAGHELARVRAVPETLPVIARGGVDLIIIDHELPGISGLELLELLRRDGHDFPVIMLVAHESVDGLVAGMRSGGAIYVAKPVHVAQLELALEQALHMVALRRENQELRREMMALRREPQIDGAAAAPTALEARPPAPAAEENGGIHLRTLNIDEAEKVLIQHALDAARNNRTRAAALLGISVRTLRNKLNGPRRTVIPPQTRD